LLAVVGTAITASAAFTTTTTTLAAVTASAMAAVRTGLAVVLFLVDPAFHSDDAVDGACFGEAVIQGDAEGLEGHLAFAVAFGAGDVSTAEATGATDANAFGTEFHGGLKGALHGAAEGNPAFELDSNLLGDELCVQFWFADFENIKFDLGIFADFSDVVGHDLDLFALATDDKART
jgi:hypothetical protein